MHVLLCRPSFSSMFAAILALVLICSPAGAQAPNPPTKVPGKAAPFGPVKADLSNDFFNKGVVPQLRVKIAKEQEQKLRAEPRKFVECEIIEDGKKTYTGVRVKIKGAAGSFRNYDDRPALTLNMAKGDENEFHGLDKFHLNNSVQDDSYISEWLCWQICKDANYPATRVTHARLWINDRDMGLYVLKEGFDEEFLKRNYPAGKGKGNLYDGGFLQEIDVNLERDEGEGAEDRADLKALVAACREGDVNKRWQLIDERLDVDAFLTFTALELMMSHWDGYVQNRNNYRVYFRPDTKKAVFFLHGMDQMFGDPNYSVFHVPGPIVPNAVLQNPQWKAKYRQIVKDILPILAPDKLHAKIDVLHKRLRPVMAAMGEDRARHIDNKAQEFKNRVNDRAKNIRAQLPPEPIAFTKEGWAALTDWTPKPEGDAKLEVKELQGRKFLSLETGPSNNCQGSFRTKVLLGKGQYKLVGRVRTTAVKVLGDGKNIGAGIRASGGDRQNKAVGSTDWQALSHDFEVAEDIREVELVVELRSAGGSAMFDAAALKVVKVK